MSTHSNYIETCPVTGPHGQPCEGEPGDASHFGHDLSGRLVRWNTEYGYCDNLTHYADQRAHDVMWMTAAERNEMEG